jgi:hypothetical protein
MGGESPNGESQEIARPDGGFFNCVFIFGGGLFMKHFLLFLIVAGLNLS